MTTTVEEARQTVCPVMRPEVASLFNGSPYCVASNCMLWRWSDPPMTNEPKHVRRPLGDQRRGYCGIAGEPKSFACFDDDMPF